MKTRIILLAIIMISIMSCNSEKKTNSEVISDTITEKYWKLKTLNGREVTMVENQTRETYFILKSEENRLKGFAGCNTFGGTFTLEKGNSIRFTSVLSTLMACPDVVVNETEFLKVFNLADHYTIKDDVLSLNIGKRAPLAVFEAVYMN
ncbi:META domain-containing protein [uncultured Lacinutrix sp.]|uniref:META domain-containing protein n=1 Tax=uncultured Lacinutrix sp. TaxID=574032 RepID=UPI0026071FBB|nr:META domain-containing protein [uncultured Lacinutrix sp.]